MIKVAKIINTHGLKGECKLYLITDEAEHRFEKGRTLYIDEKEPIVVERFRMQKGFGYAYFKGIETIEQAEALKGKSLYFPIEDLPELSDDEFYYHELVDCTVYNENGEELGKVVDILETGPNIVLRIQKGKDSFLVPFVDAFILDVDRNQRTIKIKELEGLR
ncbi:ribosome maturation factor RimM [Dubosiella newyorkensis]|jgi:16S rRNA processing protein RimM|uniref:Ribosome maturation factor RimM n=2 Tax=Dubosiella newyorkensis TaxID=1862672 RepID=A0A1U7NNL5_9FIRM|nr:ribosome maturation factor RimM [Dubosiella newyorkensis]MCI9041185.1 16S rRNA processing protein RimM [Dubosiella newyorkensis]OLU46924.1 16S rRNA processing protein RimM [Dubosiella newyorkensis]